MLQILKVLKNGIAKKFAIKKGDIILSFDNFKAEDELDYLYYDSLSSFTLKVERKNNIFEIKVDKNENETLGLEFVTNDKIETCRNNCVFCFVDQMPKGLRSSLYVKDDDYKMSFIYGNFVTLTNVSDEDIDRIIRLHLSPLYVSVHTMNGQLRNKLLGNRFADKIGSQLKRLCENGITVHAQAVIVRDVNDKDELEFTARELFKLYPQVKTFAVVPAGMTKFREDLFPIKDIDKEYSKQILLQIDKLNS
jgi:putative radical SAM enzyme (TIGR03279 family)